MKRGLPQEPSLHLAMKREDFGMVLALIASEILVNGRDAYGYTALHLAVIVDAPDEVIEALLAFGAVVDARDSSGCTAFYLATLGNKIRIMQRLLAAGAAVDAKNSVGHTPLYSVIDEARLVEVLLAAGADVNEGAADSSSATPLHRAAEVAAKSAYTGSQILQILLAVSGADVNKQRRDGQTALHLVLSTLHEHPLLTERTPYLVATLLARGADPTLRNARGETPLHLAASRGCLKSVKLLLALNALPELVDGEGRTALDVTKDPEIEKLLKGITAIGTIEGYTPGRIPLLHEDTLNTIFRVASARAYRRRYPALIGAALASADTTGACAAQSKTSVVMYHPPQNALLRTKLTEAGIDSGFIESAFGAIRDVNPAQHFLKILQHIADHALIAFDIRLGAGGADINAQIIIPTSGTSVAKQSYVIQMRCGLEIDSMTSDALAAPEFG